MTQESQTPHDARPGDEPSSDQVPWALLEALAAGELPPEEATALEARIAGDNALAAAYAEVRNVEELLRTEPLLPLPLPLVRRMLAQVVPAPRARPGLILLRVAASVLVFLAAWLAFSGGTPALADMAPQGEVASALSAVPTALPVGAEAGALLTSATAGTETTASLLLVGGGLGLMVLGLALGLRWHRRASPKKEGIR